MPAFESDSALGRILDAALQVGVAKVAPQVVQNNATDRPVTTDTPGKGSPNGQKQIDEAEKDPLRRYGPIAAVIAAVVVVLALFLRK